MLGSLEYAVEVLISDAQCLYIFFLAEDVISYVIFLTMTHLMASQFYLKDGSFHAAPDDAQVVCAFCG